MKRDLTLILLLFLTISTILSSCSKKEECMICGEMKECEKAVVMGEKLYMCSDCKDEMQDDFDELIFDDKPNDSLGNITENSNAESFENESINDICGACNKEKACDTYKLLSPHVGTVFLCLDCKENAENQGYVFEDSEYNQLKLLDIYSGIELIYNGANGFGSVEFDNYLRNVEFSVEDFYFKPADYEPYDLKTYEVLDVIYNNKEICQVGYKIIDNGK